MKYHLSFKNRSEHYLDIRVELNAIDGEETELQFPAWRPGRYELGNFAKNIKNFRVFDSSGKQLDFRKTGKDTWVVQTANVQELIVSYSYYANELNAGSTMLDDQQLFVNPVNCFLYLKDRVDAPCSVELDIPENYEIASSLKFENKKTEAGSYHELVDSPFIASDSLQHNSFECQGVIFHLWFQGECKIEWERVIRDFKGYTSKQIDAFGEFPVSEYHYLFQITPYKSYHGVEHHESTVIALGPTYDLMGSIYDDFLGVSSHELYHTWNVKAVRPIEMTPYDYSKENFSKLGYVAEGVTTYLGDVFLLKGKVFTIDQYLKEISSRVQMHFNNTGRFNLSVAESSWDTWLDGYVAGVPGRKVSIYTEGCLLAFILDIKIMRNNENKLGIHEVMKRLYDQFAGKGYSEEDYKRISEEVSKENLEEYFRDYVNGTRTLEGLLNESFNHIGMYIEKTENASYSARELGFKCGSDGILALADGSPAHMAGLATEDKILAINHMSVNNDLDKWLNYFADDQMELVIDRKGRILTVKMPQVDQTFFRNYSVRLVDEPSRAQREAFNKWSSKKD